MTTATPANLSATLAAAKLGEIIQLDTGVYPGVYDLRTPGVTIEPAPGESPVFTGPTKTGGKPAWLHIWPSAQGVYLRNLKLERLGKIENAKAFNDWGIIVSAPDVTVEGCRLQGMTKGIQIEGKDSRNATIIRNHIGPTYQSCIVLGTSYGVMRGALIGWNTLEESFIEDAIQCVQNFNAANQETDVSNFGVIIYQNMIDRMAENGIDLKGAAYVIVEGNTIRHVAGSNDGPLGGWQPDSPMSIMHGANASRGQICQVLIRNNDVGECAGGIRIFAGWKAVHNVIVSNNFSKSPAPHEGIGILQTGDASNAAAKNNLVSGHKDADLKIESNSGELEPNPTTAGDGVALTAIVGDGSGRTPTLRDAGYFTDWFGRDDLPKDTLWLNGERYVVQAVDYGANTVTLDRDATWHDGDLVYWRSPQPVVGFQNDVIDPPIEPDKPPVEPTDPPEPPVTPTDPPPVQPDTVQVTITMTVARAALPALQDAMATMTVIVTE